MEGILSGAFAPGDQAPSERQMMDLKQCSRVSVRRAYAAFQERGILEMRHGKGSYFSSDHDGHRQSMESVAVLADLNDAFALEFILCLEEAARKHGVFLVIRQTTQDPKQEVEAAADLVRNNLKHIIVWPSGKGTDFDFFSRLRLLGCNVVFFDRMRPDSWADYVATDNHHCAQSITKHLQSLNCKQASLLTYADLSWDAFDERSAAITSALEQNGITVTQHAVPWSAQASNLLRRRSFMQSLLSNESYNAIKEILPKTPAKNHAIIGINDYLAMQAKSLHPKSTVVGIDGLDDAIAMGIHSYAHPTQALADAALRQLRAQNEQGKTWSSGSHVLQGQLHIGHSEKE